LFVHNSGSWLKLGANYVRRIKTLFLTL
jgi:hypothetical protein